MSDRFDYVVVGGGTSGAVVAARLSEDADVSVCLLESGPSDVGDERIIELPRYEELLASELEVDYRIEPQARGNELIVQLRTRVLGGCSAHNTCIAFETPPSDLRRWCEATGSDTWSPKAIAPLFARVRDRMVVAPCPPDNECAQAFVASASRLGYPTRALGQGEVEVGAGWYRVNADGTRRESSAEAYLHRTPRPGRRLEIRTDTLVTRVLLDDDNVARGVEAATGTVHADREVIVCGGSFESPKLLMLSGIGDGADLRPLGIEVRHHLPGVGRHLIDHPEGIVTFEAARPLPPRVLTDWECGLFARSEPDVDVPDIMLHLSTMKFDANPVARGYPTAEHVFSIHPNVARSRSQGSVRLRDADPLSRPLIDPAYFTDPEGYDERLMVRGIEIARELAAQSPLREWIKQELAPGPATRTPEEITAFARIASNTVYHPSGTCKMGAETDGEAVLDDRLRVRGIKGLRVADTSIFPTMTTINPVLTAVMIGEKCAQLALTEGPAA